MQYLIYNNDIYYSYVYSYRNFMPFRIHKHNKCVTYLPHSHINTNLTLQPCLNTVYKGNTYSTMYSEDQLVHFLPMLGTSQQLQVHSYGNGKNNVYM